jgi:hypothetical protein
MSVTLLSRWAAKVVTRLNIDAMHGRARIQQGLEADMNGNYEFVRQVARDKQRAFAKEAREHRLAKQAGSLGGERRVAGLYARAGKQMQAAVNWIAQRTAGSAASWKAALQKSGAATR